MARLSEDTALQERIAALRPVQIQGSFFRIVSAKYQDEILSPAGSFQYGGRYNPKGEFGVLYLSESVEICIAEVLRAASDPNFFKQPRICGTIHVMLEKVLDLTDEQILKELGIRKEVLLQDTGDRERDYRLTRRISRIARAAGFEALKVPSVTSRGNNLVIFVEHLFGRAKATVMGKPQLISLDKE
ncbi:RES family NAD+ phosphorylase [Candidatus Acetothermia bacterium]|jgi:RES domain-containing protein|nr:RES family NAD+ phosphorylase [Candidatus Acetothermia bacterium]MCI2431463.1 RES family NAD+ phosphorylase [Candidatus Acetothermia bacterium]MCI2436425.1 RES family NAD+ phosphorylase [Candidatus Acetothermia bacterium]